MKKLLPALLFIISCSKDVQQPDVQHDHMYTATVSLNATVKTVSYDFFVSSDKLMWVWVARKTKYEVKGNPFSFGFDVAPLICNGITYPDLSKKLYGATRETTYGNVMLELDYGSMVIK